MNDKTKAALMKDDDQSPAAATGAKAPYAAKRVLSDFLGRWIITRQIMFADSPSATFIGHGIWRKVADGADYEEIGILQLEGAAPMSAERRYHWGDDLSVRFEDGRDFHTVPSAGGQATHFCDPDTYRVSYDFACWPEFIVRHDVTGPRKDYVMVSRFSRPDKA